VVAVRVIGWLVMVGAGLPFSWLLSGFLVYLAGGMDGARELGGWAALAAVVAGIGGFLALSDLPTDPDADPDADPDPPC